MSCAILSRCCFFLLSLSLRCGRDREKKKDGARIGDRLGVETPVAADKLDEWRATPQRPQKTAKREKQTFATPQSFYIYNMYVFYQNSIHFNAYLAAGKLFRPAESCSSAPFPY